MNFKSLVLTSTLLPIFTHSAYALDAPNALVPSDLAPSSEFYVMFVTKSTIDGTDPDVATYNLHANQDADLSSIKATNDPSINWTAIVATENGDDQCLSWYTNPNAPVYTTSGLRLADNKADFIDGFLAEMPYVDRDGISTIGTPNDRAAFTGCDDNWNVDITERLGGGVTVRVLQIDLFTFEINTITSSSTFQQSVFAVSPTLTVPKISVVPASPIPW